MRIVVDWPREKTASPVSASGLSGNSDERPRRWSKAASSWLGSLARSSGVLRTQQRLQGWFSTDSLLPAQPRRPGGQPGAERRQTWRGGDAALEEVEVQMAARSRRASFAASAAEFYPGGESHHSAPHQQRETAEMYFVAEPSASPRKNTQRRPRPVTMHAADRFGTMRGERSTVRRPLSMAYPPTTEAQRLTVVDYLRYPPVTHPPAPPPTRQCKGLFRSLSMAGHLNDLSSGVSSSAAVPQFQRNIGLRRSRSRDDLLSTRPALQTNEYPSKVVYHYPPNGTLRKPVVMVPRALMPEKLAIPQQPPLRPSGLRRAVSLSHDTKSRSLGTLLEDRLPPSPSPLPIPVLDMTESSSADDDELHLREKTQAGRIVDERETPRVPRSYQLDDHLAPVAEESSSKGSSENETERRSSSSHGTQRRRSRSERLCDRLTSRPQVAAFSSPSPESPDQPSRRTRRRASPLYLTLEQAQRERDALSDRAPRLRSSAARSCSSVYNRHSIHGDPALTASGLGGSRGDLSFIMRAPPGMLTSRMDPRSLSSDDELPLSPYSPPYHPQYHQYSQQALPRLDYPPFVTPEDMAMVAPPHGADENQRRHHVELIRAAYRARFEQRRNFPPYLQPAFVPVPAYAGCTRTPSWHENNPLPAPAQRRQAPRWQHCERRGLGCCCQRCVGGTERQDRLWKRHSFAAPSHAALHENQTNIHGEVTTLPTRGQLNSSRKKNGIIVSERLPQLSGKRPNQPVTSHAGGSRGLPVIGSPSSSREQSSHSRTDPQGRALPLSPSDAVRHYGSYMTEYELGEVEQFEEVWFLGLEAHKVAGDEARHQNAGFDDEHGSYVKVPHDHIAYRYEILEVIGRGSFGQVIRALDHKTNTQVAIKIIRNKKRFHQQALMEVKILDHLRRRDRDGHYNIIHMLDYFYFRNHLCVTFQLMGLNLFELIKKNNYQGVSMSLIRKLGASMVQCLRLLYKEGIIHCDLKPENVLLKSRSSSSIKIIDFGSSCYSHQRVYTYIQSRFYRSPEVILGLQYGTAIDVWSLGCILAELHTGFPLFPGENEVEQLACIMEVLDLPPEELILHASRRRLFFDSRGNPRSITNSKGKRRRPASRSLSEALSSSDAVFIDFIGKCITWDPARRLTPEEAARHPFLAGRCGSMPAPAAVSPPTEDAGYNIYKIYRGRRRAPEQGSTIGQEQTAAAPSQSSSAGTATVANSQQGSRRPEQELVVSLPLAVGSSDTDGEGARQRPPSTGPSSASRTVPQSTEPGHDQASTFLPPII